MYVAQFAEECCCGLTIQPSVDYKVLAGARLMSVVHAAKPRPPAVLGTDSKQPCWRQLLCFNGLPHLSLSPD